jgi:hypothetical protein
VLDFRISTYGLFITLHNTTIVDIPRGLVVTYSLLPIHPFGPFRAAPSDFQQWTEYDCHVDTTYVFCLLVKKKGTIIFELTFSLSSGSETL